MNNQAATNEFPVFVMSEDAMNVANKVIEEKDQKIKELQAELVKVKAAKVDKWFDVGNRIEELEKKLAEMEAKYIDAENRAFSEAATVMRLIDEKKEFEASVLKHWNAENTLWNENGELRKKLAESEALKKKVQDAFHIEQDKFEDKVEILEKKLAEMTEAFNNEIFSHDQTRLKLTEAEAIITKCLERLDNGKNVLTLGDRHLKMQAYATNHLKQIQGN